MSSEKKNLRVFKFRIESTLAVYADEGLLYEFVANLRSGAVQPEARIPIIDSSVVNISENVNFYSPYEFSFFMQGQEFQNGWICELVRDPDSEKLTASRMEACDDDADSEDSEEHDRYSLRMIASKQAKEDFLNSNLRDQDSEATHWNESIVWIKAANSRRDILVRFGRVLRKPSSFPKIDAFEPDDLLMKCRIAEKVYDYWKLHTPNFGEDNENRNRMNYYFLRYPMLLKMFENMKED